MRIRRSIPGTSALVALLAVALLPMPALSAEGVGGGGSWLSLLFFALNFVLFVFVVAYFAAPRTRKFFADRASEIRATLVRVDDACREALERSNQAAARLAGLAEEKARMEREFNDETAHQVRRIRQIARDGAQRIRRDAELTAAATAEEARRRLKLGLAAAAAATARELISRDFTPADQSRMLEGFVDRLSREAAP